jgi:hypothetical protein
MAFVPFENTIKLEGIYTLDGQRCENVHYYIVDETPNVDTAEDLCVSYVAWWNTIRKGHSPTALSLVLVRATIMENEFDPGIEYSTGLPVTGTQNTNPLPNNCTIAVKWTTGFRGRSFRGRTYALGLTEEVCTLSHLNSGDLAVWTTDYGELIALDTDVGPGIMGIASKFSGGVERTTGVITPVTNVFIDGTIDSQRRRLPGRGA